MRCCYYKYCRDVQRRGDTEARRQILRTPQSLTVKRKTFGFSNFLLFHLGPKTSSGAGMTYRTSENSCSRSQASRKLETTC